MRFRFFRKPEPKEEPSSRDVAYAQLLGVPLGVDEKALRAAYLRQARIYHPDRNPSGSLTMAMVNEAYLHLRNKLASVG